MKRYLLYGSSIFLTRGLEYIVLLLAPLYLTKEDYGNLEFYKKFIELGGTILSFGLPTLILSYTKSIESKKYFTLISFIFITLLTVIISPFFYAFNIITLLIPVYFHSIFFNNGIIAPYTLVNYGSNYASYYKVLVSSLFYFIVLYFVFYGDRPELSFVNVNYILLPVFLIFIGYFINGGNIILVKLKRYWSLIKKLLINSFTLVLSNFANMMFLYADIMIIKLFSKNSVDLADYSFALNISNAMILIPMTLVQVDIEKLKKESYYFSILNKKIILLVILVALVQIALFVALTNTFFENYKSAFTVFIIIIIAKVFQSISVLYGAQVIIKKMFFENLLVNIIALFSNIFLSYFLYPNIGLFGVALASAISLIIRYILLIYIKRKKIDK